MSTTIFRATFLLFDSITFTFAVICAYSLSKKWGMLKVYNCIDFSVHPCIALSSDTFCIEKKLYIPLYWESYT